jgi:hypothetical protein
VFGPFLEGMDVGARGDSRGASVSPAAEGLGDAASVGPIRRAGATASAGRSSALVGKRWRPLECIDVASRKRVKPRTGNCMLDFQPTAHITTRRTVAGYTHISPESLVMRDSEAGPGTGVELLRTGDLTDVVTAEELRLFREHNEMGMRQGLTLVHFSAQPEPFLTQRAP